MLFIAVVMVFAMLFVALQATEIISRGFKGGRHWEVSTQAFHAARSGMEKCLFEGKNRQAYKSNPAVPITVDLSSANITSQAECSIQAWAECYDADPSCPSEKYYVPKRGTGTAGGPDCQPRNATSYSATDACSWNKISYGESVSLPLFRTESDNTIKNPKDLSFDWTGFQILFRTPINPNTGSRYPVTGSNEQVVATWDIVPEVCIGKDNDGDGQPDFESCVLYAVTNMVVPIEPPDSNIKVGNLNGMYERNPSLYNAASTDGKGAVVLNEAIAGKSPQLPSGLPRIIKDLLLNSDEWASVIKLDPATNKPLMQKAHLKFSYIGELQNVPYLEYQVIYKGPALGNPDQLIFSDGYAQAGDSKYQYHMFGRQRSQTNVIDFVIQN